MEKLRKFTLFPFNCTHSLEIVYEDEPGSITNSVFSWHVSKQQRFDRYRYISIKTYARVCVSGGQCTGAYSVACNASLLMRSCGCVHAHMCVRTCMCFDICASLLCLSSKGFSPDNVMSGCVSSTNPSLDSNISSQSETPSSLCCVPPFHIQQHLSQSAGFFGMLHKATPTPPHSNMLPYYKFLMSTFSQLFRSTPPRQWMTNSQQSGDIACQRAAAILLHLESWKRDFVEDDHRWLASTSSFSFALMRTPAQ